MTPSALIGILLWLLPSPRLYLLKRFKKWFVKTPDQQIAWDHYQLKAERKGHQPKTPQECKDGKCVTI